MCHYQFEPFLATQHVGGLPCHALGVCMRTTFDNIAHACAQVSLLVALIYLLLGALRLGWACALLSKPIISAFLTAGALIISLSQVPAGRSTQHCPPFALHALVRPWKCDIAVLHASCWQLPSGLRSVAQSHIGLSCPTALSSSFIGAVTGRAASQSTTRDSLLYLLHAQVKYVVGYSIPHVDRLQDILYNLIAGAKGFRAPECAMGLAWIVLLLAIKAAPRWHKCAPMHEFLATCCAESCYSGHSYLHARLKVSRGDSMEGMESDIAAGRRTQQLPRAIKRWPAQTFL